MADESSKIPEKTVEQIFDERYPLDKWEDSNYSILSTNSQCAAAKASSPEPQAV